MKMKIVTLIALALLTVALFSGCTKNRLEMHDGYYSAEAADFDVFGWKEYVTIYVSNGKIATVEYDARNSSGFIKSWDVEYMRSMYASDGTYPNEYTRTYAVSLLNWQNPLDVNAISGATVSHSSFIRLAQAAIEQARNGNKNVSLVSLTEVE